MEHPDTSAAAPDAPPQYSHILSTLRGLTGEYDIIATDVGQHQMWTAQKYRFLHPRTFLTSCLLYTSPLSPHSRNLTKSRG